MPRNEIKAFAVAEEANVINQNEWENSQALKTGFKKGLARSSEINKAIRQSSSMAAAIAEFTAEKSGEDILDNGDITTLKNHFESALKNVSSNCIGEAGGDSDTITAETEPAIKQLVHGQLVYIRAKEKNQTKNPTLKINRTETKTIVKGNNLKLEEGDIAGAGHWLELQYDEVLDKWVLQNPAKGIISQQSGVPVGTIEYFAMATPPAGYLKADGTAVGRETYPELFFAIGTTFGEGDGSMTFNLPDLIERFAQGSNTPAQKLEAGLPNITGAYDASGASLAIRKPSQSNSDPFADYGAFAVNSYGNLGWSDTIAANAPGAGFTFSASRSNSIYGNSDTVQPSSLTLLPCIKAFDAATDPGLIDITGLANDVDGKLDKSVNGTAIKYITETYNDGTNWYRKWSDGWVEQGGTTSAINNSYEVINLLYPLVTPYNVSLAPKYFDSDTEGTSFAPSVTCGTNSESYNSSFFRISKTIDGVVMWTASGQSALSV